MAVIAPTIEANFDGNPNIIRVMWGPLANGDTGGPVAYPEYSDKTVHITGTFGAGGSVTLEGSNYRATETPLYVAVTDPQGNAVTKTSASLEVFEEATYLLRPNVTAGDGTTALTVRLICRRPR